MVKGCITHAVYVPLSADETADNVFCQLASPKSMHFIYITHKHANKALLKYGKNVMDNFNK